MEERLDMPVNNTISIRKGTESEWTSSNPVLASGELGYDITNKILKIGDGTSTWTSLTNHNHSSSNISDLNSAVSGLIPVKNITAGYDISVSDSSGNYTIASTNLVHIDSGQPQGFINRTDSVISVSGNIFTIAPTGTSYSFYSKGLKVTKSSPESLTIPNVTQINYIHFDATTHALHSKTTMFDFSNDVPIAFVSWNSGVAPSGQMTFFAEERHGIAMDMSTHRWIHNTFGAQYISGLSISNYTTSGNGSSNSHATIAISDGQLYQEDIEINITDSSSTEPFHQELSPIAQIPVYYHSGSTGQWVKNTATDYPVKYGANGPQYNLNTGGTWTTPDVSPGGATRYFAVWILATNQIDDPIISIMGQRIDNNPGNAESHNNWADIDLTNLPLNEVKPLYRLIFDGDSDYTNTPKCHLYSVLDLRGTIISTVVGIPQNDHGSLFGLADDDHAQYVHINNARTIDAIHTLSNGITFSGSGTQTGAYLPNSVNITGGSGNFSSLSVNSTGVSLSGHDHTSSNITDFTESVQDVIGSGFLIAGTGIVLDYNDSANTLTISSSGTGGGGVSITNYADNRILTSDGTSTGINAESNLTFDGTSLKVNNIDVSISGHSHTSSDISNFNSSVSGLLPVTNITAGSGISVSSSSGNYTVNSTTILSYATTASFPVTGSIDSYYLATDTSRLYQWTGSLYVEMGPPMTGFTNAQAAINLYLWSNFR
jgi:hypothetical protein